MSVSLEDAMGERFISEGRICSICRITKASCFLVYFKIARIEIEGMISVYVRVNDIANIRREERACYD